MPPVVPENQESALSPVVIVAIALVPIEALALKGTNLSMGHFPKYSAASNGTLEYRGRCLRLPGAAQHSLP